MTERAERQRVEARARAEWRRNIIVALLEQRPHTLREIEAALWERGECEAMAGAWALDRLIEAGRVVRIAITRPPTYRLT